MDTLNEASIIITIPAPIHNTGNTEVSKPELGSTTKAIEDKIAPTKNRVFFFPTYSKFDHYNDQ